MKTITVEILPDGRIVADWWSEQLQVVLCSVCSKEAAGTCDKITCLVNNKYCG